MSLMLWYNLITAPLILLWPELSLEEENKNSWYMLWANELFWTLDMARKFFNKRTGRPINDTYELAQAYIKSTLILDVIATLPQILSGINPSFAYFKIVRIYDLSLLHYPMEIIFKMHYSDRDR